MPEMERVINIVETETDLELTRLFWKKKSPDERLSAVELLREQFYLISGYREIPSIVREINLLER